MTKTTTRKTTATAHPATGVSLPFRPLSDLSLPLMGDIVPHLAEA